MPDRCIPVARMRVYPAGAKGYITDPGWAWYSPIARDGNNWYDEDGYEFEIFELGGHVFTAPKPQLCVWDMEEAQWTQDAGTWESRYWDDNVLGMWVDGAIAGAGQLTSLFYHTEAPCFSVVLSASGQPQEWTVADGTPYLNIIWGDLDASAERRWSLSLDFDGGVYINWLDPDASSHFEYIGSSGFSWPKQGEDWAGITIMVLHICGGLAIKCGTSDSWLFYEDADGPILPSSGGQFRFYVEPSLAKVKLALMGVTGPNPDAPGPMEYHSDVMVTDRVRDDMPECEGRYEIPTVAVPVVAPDCVVEAVDHTTTDEAEVLVTMTVGYASAYDGGGDLAEQAGRPNSYLFPYFPEFYASHLWWGPIVDTEAGSYTEIISELIHTADVRLPDEGMPSDASLDIDWRTGELGVFTDYWYMRICELALGWMYDDDSVSLDTVITGFVTSVTAQQNSPSLVRAQIKIADITAGLRMVECDDNWPVMDWWDGDAAMEHIAAKMGLDSALYDFSSVTGLWLSYGIPEAPLWQPQPGTSAWDFLERIARYFGRELAVTAAGVIYTRDITYMETGTEHTITSTALFRNAPPVVERRNAFGFTGVDLRGCIPGGMELQGIIADTDAESTPAYAYFQGFRKLERFDEAGIVDQTDADDLAAILYENQRVRQGDRVGWRTTGFTTAWRRDMAYLLNLTIGVGNTDRLGVLELAHHWGPRKTDCYTDWVACFYASLPA